ncbi:MAG: hypothetical protein GIKADHBN_02911 [Phycisphaerales bacterium]|nr:hypothetical protein [Phycisphaerales bacterium]
MRDVRMPREQTMLTVAFASMLAVGAATAPASIVPAARVLSQPEEAQPTDVEPEMVVLEPRLKKGQRAVYSVTRSDVKSKATRAPKPVKGRESRAEIVVIETEPNYVLSYSVDLPLLDEIELPKDADAAATTQKLLEEVRKMPPVEVEFTHEGELVGMRNWDAVRGPALKASQAVLEVMKKSMPEEQFEFVARWVENSYAPDGMGQQMLIGDAWTCFMGYGYAVPVQGQREEEIEFDNPLGGDPLPGRMTLRVRPKGAEKDVTTVEYKSRVDPAAAGKAMKESMERLTGRDPDGQELILDMEESATYVYDGSTGWLRRTEWERRVISGPSKRVQKRTYVLVQGPDLPEQAPEVDKK